MYDVDGVFDDVKVKIEVFRPNLQLATCYPMPPLLAGLLVDLRLSVELAIYFGI